MCLAHRIHNVIWWVLLSKALIYLVWVATVGNEPSVYCHCWLHMLPIKLQDTLIDFVRRLEDMLLEYGL